MFVLPKSPNPPVVVVVVVVVVALTFTDVFVELVLFPKEP